MMNQNQKDFLSLISSVVCGTKPVLSAQPDVEAVMDLAAAHRLLPLVNEAILQVPALAEAPCFLPYQNSAVSMTVMQIRRTHAFLYLYSELQKNGLEPIVLKGIVCRLLYGEYRDHRTSGDEDLLIEKKDLELADRVLREYGFEPDQAVSGKAQLDAVQEVTYTGTQIPLRLELHLNPFGSENELREKMNAGFADCFSTREMLNVDGVSIRTLEPQAHYLFLILHALKHFTFGGFGVRQILDIMLFEKQYRARLDLPRIYDELSKADGLTFYSDLVAVGNRWLGFCSEQPLPDICPEALLEDVLESGIYGNGTQQQRTAAQMVSAAVSADGKTGGFRVFWNTLFPDRRQFVSIRPEIEDKPWLIHEERLKRFGRFLRHRKQSSKDLAAESMALGKKRLELLAKYGLVQIS